MPESDALPPFVYRDLYDKKSRFCKSISERQPDAELAIEKTPWWLADQAQPF